MSYVLDFFSLAFLAGGAFFCVVGALGMLRLPDFYTRTHPASMIDTMGAALILIGLCFQATSWAVAVRLVVIFVLILITSPTAAHALVKAAYAHGVRIGKDVPRVDASERPIEEREAQVGAAHAEDADGRFESGELATAELECEGIDHAN